MLPAIILARQEGDETTKMRLALKAIPMVILSAIRFHFSKVSSVRCASLQSTLSSYVGPWRMHCAVPVKQFLNFIPRVPSSVIHPGVRTICLCT